MPSFPSQPASPARRRGLRAVTLLALASLSLSAAAAGDDRTVSLEQARADHEAGRVVLIDIREPHEHARGVAAGAKLLPMQQLDRRLAEIPKDPSKPVYLICNTQNRSSYTLSALRRMGGYDHVRSVEGGMSEWVRRGWPVVRPAP